MELHARRAKGRALSVRRAKVGCLLPAALEKQEIQVRAVAVVVVEKQTRREVGESAVVAATVAREARLEVGPSPFSR